VIGEDIPISVGQKIYLEASSVKKKLWFILLLVVILAIPTLSAFAAPAKIKVGFLVKMPEELWFQQEWYFAQKCADEFGFDLVKIGTPNAEQVFAAIDTLAAQRAQGFVICTPDVHLGPAIMARANAKKLKVFTVDDQFVSADGKFMSVPYMGLSARNIGEDVGKALYAEFKKRGWKVEETGAAAITFDELNTVKERTDGTTAALVAAGFPAGKIYRAPEKTTDVPGSMEAGNALLSQHPEVKKWLVFSVNEEGVIGTIRAMEGRGFNADTIIGIGIGAGIGINEFLKEKPTGFFATSAISPYRHGYETTKLLYDWIKNNKKPPMDTRTSGYICTRENYKEVMEKIGLGDVLKNIENKK
jgi:ABC-type sugar transport system, periplasmic component